jgi:hypothetical protein
MSGGFPVVVGGDSLENRRSTDPRVTAVEVFTGYEHQSINRAW